MCCLHREQEEWHAAQQSFRDKELQIDQMHTAQVCAQDFTFFPVSILSMQADNEQRYCTVAGWTGKMLICVHFSGVQFRACTLVKSSCSKQTPVTVLGRKAMRTIGMIYR